MRNPYGRVLACADSNIATDNLYTKIRQLAPWARALRMGEGAAEEVQRQAPAWLGSFDFASREERLNTLRKAAPEAQVVAATCVGSGNELLDAVRGFDLCVIDEASQALEPSTLVALQRAGPGVRHVVLVGDHKQLPATVLSNIPEIGISLFERLIHRGVEPTMLLEQRRMHSAIAEFPSLTFYDGQLLNAVSDEMRPPVTNTVELVNVASAEPLGNEAKRGQSTCNNVEAERLCDYLRLQGLNNRTDISVGVLTPYAAQKSVLLELLRARQLLRAHIRVDTIDGFQGMEQDVILFSAVRSNPRGDLGFLEDERRMNVMLTRARCSLIVFADAVTLSAGRNGHWARWISWVSSRGVVSGDEFVPRQ